jgi:predicted transcriptional regulator
VVNAKRVDRAPAELVGRDETSEIRRTFARNLRHARESVGLTQNGLAQVASCSRGLIAEIETSATNVKLDTITRLAKALGLAEIDLLRPSGEPITAKRYRRAPAELLPKAEPTEFRRRFARNLREIRRKAGLFQSVLAKVAEVQGSAVVEIEVHAINVTLDTVTRLAKALGVREIDLLGPVND